MYTCRLREKLLRPPLSQQQCSMVTPPFIPLSAAFARIDRPRRNDIPNESVAPVGHRPRHHGHQTSNQPHAIVRYPQPWSSASGSSFRDEVRAASCNPPTAWPNQLMRQPMLRPIIPTKLERKHCAGPTGAISRHLASSRVVLGPPGCGHCHTTLGFRWRGRAGRPGRPTRANAPNWAKIW